MSAFPAAVAYVDRSAMQSGIIGPAILIAAALLPLISAANTNEVLWGEPDGGMALGIQVDPAEFGVHCWVKNVGARPIAYIDYYFGYFEEVQLEIRQSGRWNSFQPVLYPRGPGFSSAEAEAGGIGELAPNEVMITRASRMAIRFINDRWPNRAKALAQAATNDTFLVDLISSVPTNLLSQTSLEFRVVQKFHRPQWYLDGSPAFPDVDATRLTQYSPVCTLRSSQLESMLLQKKAEQDNAADRSQPSRSGADRASEAAGSRR